MFLYKSFFLAFFFFSIFSWVLSLKYFYIKMITWLEFDLFMKFYGVPVKFLLMFDWMSLMFLSTVSIITSLVFIYSKDYMSNKDLGVNKFYFLIFLFVLSMMLMILSPNLLSIILGWDGLGLISYCLVIYYSSKKAFSAGMLTFLSNRFGDIMLLISMTYVYNWGMYNFYETQIVYSFCPTTMNMMIVIFIILASFTKSAQIPFSAWLPAAMAAPTPVSSLVHSSTLVTAGVYLLIRFSYMFQINMILMWISAATIFMSSLSAIYETDLKKIIALSTLSQMGLMMMTISFGLKEMSFMHLITHALFKSLMFLCAGTNIHLMFNYQDIRFSNKPVNTNSSMMLYFNITNMSLMGFPFMCGFYSKDLIIETIYLYFHGKLMVAILLLSISMTFIYSMRILKMSVSYYTYLNLTYFINPSVKNFFCTGFMIFSLVLFSGSMVNWLLMPLSMVYLNTKLKTLFLVMLMICYTMMIWFLAEKFCNSQKSSFEFFIKMWFLNIFSSSYLMSMNNLSLKTFKFFDQGWMEFFGPQKIYSLMLTKSWNINSLIASPFKLILFFSISNTVVMYMI